ncbi:MAG TPA: hypothetical protein VF589_12695 [Allosphingosinicella sp.]
MAGAFALRPEDEMPCAPAARQQSADPAAAVHAILSVPDDELDYACAKLALDRIVDPSIDVQATMVELHRMAGIARELAGPSATDGAKLAALRKLIYESGPWNDHRPFGYDHSDPHGQHLPRKLLHNYLAGRLGQCVSMPILFLILADWMGLRVALASAPEHIFVRYTDGLGRTINLETTSGAHPARDVWYRHCFLVNDRAIESGLYMRTLSRREGAALMATTVAEHLRAQGRYEEVIAVCETILEHDRRAGAVMVMQGSAYGVLLHQEFERQYPLPFLIPEQLRARRLRLIERNNSLISAAEALGWSCGEFDSKEEGRSYVH